MLIYLDRDDILDAIKAQLGQSLNISIVDADLGFINNEPTVVIAVNQDLPDDLFEEDSSEISSNQEVNVTSDMVELVGTKEAKGGKRRKRRTRAEIEADEAKAKQAAETQQSSAPVAETKAEAPDEIVAEAQTQKAEEVLEAKSEEAADTAEAVENPFETAAVEEDNLFSDSQSAATSSVAEEVPEPQGATTNPFGDDNLFADAGEAHVDSPVKQEGGFAKPAEDDDAINLFA